MSEEQKAPIRIDVETLTAHCGSGSWKINKEGHIDPIRSQLIEIVTKYEGTYKKILTPNYIGGEAERQKAQTEQTKGILESGLVGFEYDKAAKDADIGGPGSLNILATEVYTFLCVLGGKIGMRSLQMRSMGIKSNV